MAVYSNQVSYSSEPAPGITDSEGLLVQLFLYLSSHLNMFLPSLYPVGTQLLLYMRCFDEVPSGRMQEKHIIMLMITIIMILIMVIGDSDNDNDNHDRNYNHNNINKNNSSNNRNNNKEMDHNTKKKNKKT